ncbi:Putative MetA-pathway of phenol degradation [Flaviramulus basaltis]|uniref:Putative MetA-pathway of phenol degradation n=1 Tax=Flaviramulus basaltis TaxID=369401 RepID=A0A1K2IAX7_9FLAO|nr:transporter [Flaviramulus basaltis]SFZ89572.1 Putative MetA-pathway of phenol degradation [Flaviramulus basaltis]
MKNLLVATLCVVTSITFSQEKETNLWTSNRPDGHAPISIMGDHIHHKGELMFSYRYMTMDMRHLRQDTYDATNADAHANYMVSPQNMTMNMHMLSIMYALSNKLTLMAMSNYLKNDMDLQMRNGNEFSTNTSGLGDISVSALYSIFNKNRKELHAHLGIYIPTGSIEKKGMLPMSMGNEVQLPYTMQTGTGSFGAKLGLTYLGQCKKFSWGHQLTGIININDNEQDYKFGNRYNFNNWFAAKAGNNLSISVRLEAVVMVEIDGSSSLLNPMMVSTADTKNSGGTYLNSGFGLNYLATNGNLDGLRFATEISTPFFQNLNGIQLKQNYNLTFGMQYAFH